MLNVSHLEKTRDLSLPQWGPYSKDHFALSHIADPSAGRLFECVLIPGIHSERVFYPDKRDCWNITPVEARRDLSFYRTRFLMDPACQADVTVRGLWHDRRLIDVAFLNSTDGDLGFRLDFALGFQKEEPATTLALRPGETFLPAYRYETLNVSLPATAVDQLPEGSVASGLFVERVGLGPAFTRRQGAQAAYDWNVQEESPAARLGIRYALSGSSSVEVSLHFQGSRHSLQLTPTCTDLTPGSLKLATIPNTGTCSVGHHKLNLEITHPSKNGDLFIDGFFMLGPDGEPDNDDRVKTIRFEPKLERHVEEDFFAIRSPLSPNHWYGVLKDQAASAPFHVWKLSAGDMTTPYRRLGCTSRYWTRDRIIDRENEHVVGDLRPLFCSRGSRLSLRTAVGFADNPGRLKEILAETLDSPEPPAVDEKPLTLHVSRPEYRQSLQAVTAAAYTTICYPQDLLAERVKHFAPGAFFPTLYLWDAGIQSLGLASHDPQHALENVNVYLPPLDDPKPVILHGSVLPTQIFAWWEIYQQTNDSQVLAALYPKIRRYYRFMAGKENSQMDPFGTGLLCPWAYFYNSAGWDDYPAQAHVADQGLGQKVSPVANTAYTIRAARLLALAAEILGRENDSGEYQADVNRSSEALHTFSWDRESGYFGYVVDETKAHLKAPDGSNFNRGLDGVSPLVAGLPAGDVRQRLIDNCTDPTRLWTDLGLSTVDQSASYFSTAGYWNGAVWIAHQWFFFKAFLDCGEFDLARRLAKQVASAWKNAVAQHRGQTFEALHISTRRGIGTPHFNALSLPVVPLYQAVLEPGHLTAGFDTVRRNTKFSPEDRRLEAEIANPLRPGPAGVLAVMDRPGTYEIEWMGNSSTHESDENGCLGFILETASSFAKLVIHRK